MKRPIFALCFLLLCSGLLLADDFPVPLMKDAVSDYANVVEPQAIENVRAMADELLRVTSVNYKVLVIRQLPPGMKVEAYGRQVYKQWDVGRESQGFEHGALLLISIIDRQVKLVTGKEVDWVISDKSRDQTEWDVLAILSRGQFSQGVEIGTIEFTNKILAGWYASHKAARFAVDWQAASLVFFALFAVSLVATLVTGSDPMMGFTIFVGGYYGFLFLNIAGLLLFGFLGFLLTYKAGRHKGEAPKDTEAKKS